MSSTKWRSGKEWLDAAPAGTLRYVFPGGLEQVREARKVVEELFTGTGREDDAGLIVDELANNSLLYTRSGQPGGWFGVEITFGTLVRVGVTDLGGAGWMIGQSRKTTGSRDTSLEADLDGYHDEELDGLALGGRGLAIVAELAVTTGACGSDSLGHVAWADLDLTGDAESAPLGSSREEAHVLLAS